MIIWVQALHDHDDRCIPAVDPVADGGIKALIYTLPYKAAAKIHTTRNR